MINLRNNSDTPIKSTHLLTFLAIVIFGSASAEPFYVVGWVKKEEDGQALAGVTVTAEQYPTGAGGDTATTNPIGFYVLSIDPEGTYQMEFNKSGRQPIKGTGYLKQGATVNADMRVEFQDPPNDDDYDYWNVKMEIDFKDGDKYYKGFQEKSKALIFYDNSNFDRDCACSDYAKAADGQPNKENYRVSHFHHRYNYGTAPDDGPGWDPDPPDTGLPNWPTASEGAAFWDWVYDGKCDGGGTSANMNSNCVSYAFNGLNGNDIRVTTHVSSGDWPNNSNIDKLWNALPTEVATGDISKTHIYDGDIAGNGSHVWVLHDPDGGDGEGPATKVKWRNSCSGTYTWTHSVNPHNCAPYSPGDSETTINANLKRVVSVDDPDLYKNNKIKREAGS